MKVTLEIAFLICLLMANLEDGLPINPTQDRVDTKVEFLSTTATSPQQPFHW